MDTTLANRLDTLQNQVANTTDVRQSVVTLCQGLAREIRNAMGDQLQLQTIIDKLEADDGAIGSAVIANTSAPQRTMAAGYGGAERQPDETKEQREARERDAAQAKRNREQEQLHEPVGGGKKR
jgi:hypothetical protein